MIYSVWDHASRRYDYYQTSERSAAVNAPRPKHLSGAHDLGLAPEEAAWPLPRDAKLVGHGKTAKGQVAEARAGIGLGFFDVKQPLHAVLLGGLALALFVEFRRRRR